MMKLAGFQKFGVDHLRTWWALWAGLLGVGYLVYKITSPVADLFRGWVISHARVDNGTVALDGWPPTVLATFCFVTLSLLGLSMFTIVMVFRQGSKSGRHAVRSDILLKTFNRTIQAA